MKLARAALVVPFLLLGVACGGQPGDVASTAGSAADQDVPAEVAPGSTELAAGGLAADGAVPSAGQREAARTPTQTRAVISRGQVSLESPDLEKVRFELVKLLDLWGGTLAGEESSADDDGSTDFQSLELRVPSRTFEDAMDAISRLGTLVERSRTSEDVTTQVIDLAARVRSQRLSLARLQSLLARAENLSQVIAIESQLSQRQAELDSVEQQQKYLADQTAESTITVYLSRPGATSGDEERSDGFLGGLRDGWDAFGSAASSLLHGLGAALPFAALVLVIALPLLVVRRRRRPTAPGPGVSAR